MEHAPLGLVSISPVLCHLPAEKPEQEMSRQGLIEDGK